MPIVECFMGTTALAIKVRHLDPVAPIVKEFTRRNLVDWEFNYRKKRREISKSYLRFVHKEGILYIPVGFFDRFKAHMECNGYKVKVTNMPPDHGRVVEIEMNPKFKDMEHQIDPIKYLSDESVHRKGLQLQTGKGKTYCATKSMVNIGRCGIIIVSGLVHQWYESIAEQTNAGQHIYVIKGFKSIANLIKTKYKPKLFVCSLETLRGYIEYKHTYEGLPRWHEFVEMYGIGTRITDEVHLNFHANVNIDLASNIKNNIYLTATFDNSNRGTRQIFDVVFPSNMRFGADAYDRYGDIVVYGINGLVNEKKCVRRRGYSHGLYEQQLLKHNRKFALYAERYWIPVINAHYINVRKKGDKMVIFCALTEMSEMLKKRLEQEYPKLVVGLYIGNADKSLLDESDIIITNIKKCSTGTDIPWLIFGLNTISLKASNTLRQMFGRLRKLKDGRTPMWADIVDFGVESQVRHYGDKKLIYQSMAKEYKEFKL